MVIKNFMLQVSPTSLDEILSQSDNLNEWIIKAEHQEKVMMWEDNKGESDTPDAGVLIMRNTWHVLDFLITGTDNTGECKAEEPLCYILNGGLEVGNIGLDPVRYISSEQLQKFSDALSEISDAQLKTRYSDEVIKNKIYLMGWNVFEEEDIDHFLSVFHALKFFVKQAIRKGFGILIYLL